MLYYKPYYKKIIMEVSLLSKKGVIAKIESICNPLAEGLGYELVDVEFIKEDSAHFLRIYLDKPGGINLDDCQKMSEVLSEKLDEEDPITMPYYLEVSSPGLDRPLKTDKDLKRNIGKALEIKLYKNLEGKKTIEGDLEDYNDMEIIIRTEANKIISIPREIVSIIKLAIKF